MLLLTATNMVSARSYGEFEYWFSSIKVVAIVLFLGMGALWITGLWPDSTPGLGNLVSHGGFTPLAGARCSPRSSPASPSTPGPRS